jgi:uncharacterized protein (TIGR00299 family) protein
MSLLYLDCQSGVSGDMFLGALLDLGLPLEKLEQGLCALSLDGYRIQVTKVERGPIYATKLTFDIDPTQQYRHLHDIEKILNESTLSPQVVERSLKVFMAIAEAEAKVHGSTIEKIHFHEIGAMDTILDVVGVMIGLEALGIEQVHASPLAVGHGSTSIDHGRVSLPVPATLEILKEVPLEPTMIPFELVTPTGAALIKVLAKTFGPMPPLQVDKIGYGAGTRDLTERANVLRAVLGQTSEADLSTEPIDSIEANIDDLSPEVFEHIAECLFAAGAVDVALQPIQMKKFRPAVQLRVLSHPQNTSALMDIIFRETSTIGLRIFSGQKKVLKRDLISFDSTLGPVQIKVSYHHGAPVQIKPEYEDCKRIAQSTGRPFNEIFQQILLDYQLEQDASTE